jgi:hypothetical protein
LPAIFAVVTLLFEAAQVHGQATGGDIFNVNPGGAPGAPPSPSPGGDQFDTHTKCRTTGWFSSSDGTEKWRYIILPADQAQRFQSLISTPDGQVRIRGCTDWCSATTKLCLVLQATPPPPIPPRRNPQQPGTDCLGLLAQARATAAAIEGGSTSPLVMQGLIRVLQQCPPAFPRPIDCFDMMVDAQSKVRTNPNYSERRAQEALLCYEKQDSRRGARRETSRQPPTFHYFYINGIHTPMDAQMVTAKGIQPVRLKGVPGGYYTYEHDLVNRNLVHWPGLRIENEVDHMEGYTHNFSQMDPLWTSLGAKFCAADQQYVGSPAKD